MTDSKLAPVDALVHQAIREEVGERLEGQEITAASTMAEITKVLGASAKQAATLIPAGATKAPRKVTDARSPETLARASLALVQATGNDSDLPAAFNQAGLNKEMLLQALESPDWQANVVSWCQKLIFSMNLPAITSALVTKAKMADPQAAKLLFEMFGKSELDRLDEQTKALSEASPETRLRHTKALIEDLQRMVTEQERAGAQATLVDAARAAAVSHLTERKQAR